MGWIEAISRFGKDDPIEKQVVTAIKEYDRAKVDHQDNQRLLQAEMALEIVYNKAEASFKEVETLMMANPKQNNTSELVRAYNQAFDAYKKVSQKLSAITEAQLKNAQNARTVAAGELGKHPEAEQLQKAFTDAFVIEQQLKNKFKKFAITTEPTKSSESSHVETLIGSRVREVEPYRYI